MKCFSFSNGEKKDEFKTTKSSSVKYNTSTFTENDMRRSGSGFNSQDISNTSGEFMGRSSFLSFSQRSSNLRVFTYQEVKTATKSFSPSAMLGEGRFSCVYKGLMKNPEDPTKNMDITVKELGGRGLQVVGTMGYAAPEYLQTGHLTYKTDIWNYGVFIYELITGRRALDRHRPRSEQKHLEFVLPYLSDPKKFRLIIDPRLESKYSLKSVQKLAIVPNSDLGQTDGWLSRLWTPKLIRSC